MMKITRNLNYLLLVLGPIVLTVPADSQAVVTVLYVDTNSVNEGNRMTILCQVTGLQNTDIVLIHQITDSGDNVVWMRDGELKNPDGDGSPEAQVVENGQGNTDSVLIFNAINRTNAGKYLCFVVRTVSGSSNFDLLASDSIDVIVHYLPPTHFPICSSNEHSADSKLNILIGESIEFNCFSEDGYPQISLIWTQGNSMAKLIRGNGTVQSTLNITASSKNNGTFFTCQIYSTLDYANNRSCSVGPLNVRPLSSNVTSYTGLPDTILGFPFPIFVISATGIGLFAFLTLLLIGIYCYRNFHCVCYVTQKSFSTASRKSYDLSHAHASTKEANDFWTEKRPSRVAPPPPIIAHRRLQPLESLPSQTPKDKTDVSNIPLKSYPPPPPSPALMRANQDKDQKPKTDTTCNSNPEISYPNTSFPIIQEDDVSNGKSETELSSDSWETSEDEIDAQNEQSDINQNEMPSPYPEQIVYYNVATLAKELSALTSYNNIKSEDQTNVNSKQKDSDTPLTDLNSSEYTTGNSKTLPRPTSDFPIYAKPNKSKLKRSSSLPSAKKAASIKPAKPSFQPPPPPPPSSKPNGQGRDEVKRPDIVVIIGPSTDAVGYASVTH